MVVVKAVRREPLGIGGHLGRDRVPEVDHGRGEPLEAGRIEAGEGGGQHVVLHQLHLVHERAAGVGGTHEHDPPVARDADALHESALLHAVDDPGRAGHRGVDDLRQAPHRHRLVVVEQRQDVEMGHAEAEPQEPLRCGATERSEGTAHVDEHRLDGLASFGRRCRRGGCSHGMKYLPWTNSCVKWNCSTRVEE